jgi:acetolactate synthase-1/2/3 large subunit
MGYRVEKTDDFVPLIEKCNNTPGVHLVELPVDYSENDRILNHEIKERSQKI